MTQGLTNVPAGDVTKKDLAQKAEKTHQHSTTDITSGTLPVSRGGTGATTAANARTNLGITPANIGAAASSHSHNYAGSSSAGGSATSAVKLQTARTIKVNLGSTSSANFDGTANITPGVDGTLPIANGGTGATSASAARTALGAFSSNGGTISGDVKINGVVAEGNGTTASGDCSHAEGNSCIASGDCSHAEGNVTIASESDAHAEGFKTTASGYFSHAEGGQTTASGHCSHAEGCETTASENCSHAEGAETIASGIDAHAEGSNTTASGHASHAEGVETIAKGYGSHAGGYYTIASGSQQTVIGEYNKESAVSTDIFIIGNGVSYARSNCFRVTKKEGVFSNAVYNSTGADYAELFQWLDDNIKKEDRVGLFVTLDGEKIKVATPEDDYILGVVSACPSVLGDVYNDDWKDRWEKDIFGRIIFEEVEVPAETIEISDPDNPEQKITKVVQEAHTEICQKLNPDYDPTQEYIPRSKRPEWDAVGMMGKLVVIDDGTCKVNGWCTVGHGGIATSSEKQTKFRVMARLDETHIKIMIL